MNRASGIPRPEIESAEPSRKRRAIGSYVLKAILGIGILSFVLSRIDLRHLMHVLGQERPLYFLAATAIYVAGQMIAARRWQLLARMIGIAGSYADYLLYFFIGAFTNLFVPGLVGGDAARALYLGRRHHQIGKAVASVIADRAFGLMVLIWVTAVCVALLGRGVFPSAVTTPIFFIGAAAMAGYLAMPLAARLQTMMPRRIAATLAVLSPYLEGRIALIPALL